MKNYWFSVNNSHLTPTKFSVQKVFFPLALIIFTKCINNCNKTSYKLENQSFLFADL